MLSQQCKHGRAFARSKQPGRGTRAGRRSPTLGRRVGRGSHDKESFTETERGNRAEPFPLLSSSLGLELKSRRSEATAAAGSPRLARRSAERESKSVITHHLWLLKSDWIDDFCGIRDHRSRFTLRRLPLSPSDFVRWNHKMKRAKLSSLQKWLHSYPRWRDTTGARVIIDTSSYHRSCPWVILILYRRPAGKREHNNGRYDSVCSLYSHLMTTPSNLSPTDGVAPVLYFTPKRP